jgi:hypothetical protein
LSGAKHFIGSKRWRGSTSFAQKVFLISAGSFGSGIYSDLIILSAVFKVKIISFFAL